MLTIELMAALGFFNSRQNDANRIRAIKLYLRDYWEWDFDKLTAAQKALIDTWSKYVDSEREDLRQFDLLKRMCIAAFTEKSYYEILAYTNFLHRTNWLREKGMGDAISKTPLR